MNSSIPQVTNNTDITELFRNFNTDWHTLSPVLWLLYGILFAFFVLMIIKKIFTEDD